jgi:hypothetical protein
MELWSGGGCQRRCDTETELLSGKPCMCEPGAEECKPTTRMSVMIRDVPGIGVWRLESHGWNAAAELPPVVQLLASQANGRPMPAVLRLEPRTAKQIVDGKPQTRKFVVPVLDLPGVTMDELGMVAAPRALNAPAPVGERPALSAGGEPVTPADPQFEEHSSAPGWGPAPTTSHGEEAGQGAETAGDSPESPRGASREAAGDEAPTPPPALMNEISSLSTLLVAHAVELGKGAETKRLAANHLAEHGPGETHVAWLKTQIGRAQEALEEKAVVAEAAAITRNSA